LADLFIDSLPYGAHTTASDALWAGLPVLTCLGKSFVGRVAASLLCAIKLPELIAKNCIEFEEMAVELAHDPEKLQGFKKRLELNRLTTPLFDTQLFTRNIERAYQKMMERHQMGLPPDHLDIESS
jgi:predicted O-linked N-acetylglucosamine transferase (SPINDLY family)